MNESSSKLLVLSLVGPSGAGKSTVLKSIQSKNNILEEKYMALNKYNLDNRLLISKWAYINYWFDNVIQAKEQGDKLLITDRCPYDTCAYVTNGSNELFEILVKSFDELKELGIEVKTVLMTGEFSHLQGRINTRLKVEKEREFYNERNQEHNLRAYNFFRSKEDFWDFIVNTSSITEAEVEKKVSIIIDTINTNR